MKIRCFILLLLFKFGNSFSQINILNESLIYPDSAILYVGIDNYLKIDGLDSTKQYYVSSSFGNLQESSFRNRNEFVMRLSNANYLNKIIVYDNHKQIIYSKDFRVDFIGNPIARLDSISEGMISKNQLLNSKQLYIVMPNCLINHKLQILSFQVYFQCKKCDNFPVIQNFGPFLPAQFFKLIPFLTFGDKITFEEIKITGPDDISRKIPSVTYTIK